jgi:hypothetical protein
MIKTENIAAVNNIIGIIGGENMSTPIKTQTNKKIGHKVPYIALMNTIKKKS